MIAHSRDSEDNGRTAVVDAPMQRARRIITSALVIRSKEELAPPAPLPAWTRWLLLAWLIAAGAAYAAILTGVWR